MAGVGHLYIAISTISCKCDRDSSRDVFATLLLSNTCFMHVRVACLSMHDYYLILITSLSSWLHNFPLKNLASSQDSSYENPAW